jgi:hypothetical protein
MILLAIVAYVVYQNVMRENMTNSGTIGTAIAVVVGIALLGAAYMYVTSK